MAPEKSAGRVARAPVNRALGLNTKRHLAPVDACHLIEGRVHEPLLDLHTAIGRRKSVRDASDQLRVRYRGFGAELWKLLACFKYLPISQASMFETTRYFQEQVVRKRPFLKPDWIMEAISQSAHRIVQPDGRVRYWVFVPEMQKWLRVVTLEDGKTVHNAFLDRDYPKESK